MTESVTVRPGTTDDAAAIRRVARPAWHAAHADIVGASAVDDFLATHYEEGVLRERIGDSTRIVRVAERESTAVGFAIAGPADDGPADGSEDAAAAPDRTFALGSIYVHPDRWGEGIGSRLVDAVERGARSRGGERLRLVVMADNDVGIRFYEGIGFERVGDHYDENLDVEGYVYAKDL